MKFLQKWVFVEQMGFQIEGGTRSLPPPCLTHYTCGLWVRGLWSIEYYLEKEETSCSQLEQVQAYQLILVPLLFPMSDC